MNKSPEKLLANWLKEIAVCEKGTEVIKQIIAQQHKFEPMTCFKRLDRKSKHFISQSDIISFLM